GAMGQLNKATQQNASASEELAATAEEMGGQAEQLQEVMGFFKVAPETGRTARAPARAAAAPVLRRAARATATAAAPSSPDFERF
ncbi:MAG: methyl-accepting chemotaxis protein, partial [Rhodocyclaceae bacterium]|nr:methyl-accepting chemotaxis protein [Rhodocyclaceae bacterium]